FLFITLRPPLSTLFPYTTLFRSGQLIAAIELVSPRNKDRADAKETYANRYLGYLRLGVHLMLVDVLPRPKGFSFSDVITDGLGRSEEHTSELQSQSNLVCRLLLE